MKCSRIGCSNEGLHIQYPICGMIADAYFCAEHMDEGLASLKESSQLRSSEVRYNSTAFRVVDDMLDELAKSPALRRLFKLKLRLINQLLDSDEKQETE